MKLEQQLFFFATLNIVVCRMMWLLLLRILSLVFQ